MKKAVIFHFVLGVFWGSFLALIPGTLKSQTTDSTRHIIENGFIEKMSHKIAVDLSVNNSYTTFEVITSSNRILLYPNTPNNLRLKFNYEFISFGIQFAPTFLPGNGDSQNKGNTASLQIGTNLIFPHWFAFLSYSAVKGFYLQNTSDYDPYWVPGDPYIQFPDLLHTSYSISLGYSSNAKFSMRNLLSQTERQLKSTGSFMPVLNYDYYVVDDQSSGNSTQKSNNNEMNLGPGYAYTFVFREKFYISLGAFASLGYLHTKLTTRTIDGDFITNQDNLLFRWDGKAGIGYNGHKYYGGAYSNLTGSNYTQENTTVRNVETKVYFHVFFGMRFSPPKYVKRKMDEAKGIIP